MYMYIAVWRHFLRPFLTLVRNKSEDDDQHWAGQMAGHMAGQMGGQMASQISGQASICLWQLFYSASAFSHISTVQALHK